MKKSVNESSRLTRNLDNKGVSSYLFEEAMKSDASAAPGFVAAFSQSSVGDTSPNVLGTWCDSTGDPCDFEHSTCGGTTEDCHGHGPEYQKLDLGVSSCYEIGTRVYDAAKALYVGVLYRSMWKSANNYRMTSIARRQRWLIPASGSTT